MGVQQGLLSQCQNPSSSGFWPNPSDFSSRISFSLGMRLPDWKVSPPRQAQVLEEEEAEVEEMEGRRGILLGLGCRCSLREL